MSAIEPREPDFSRLEGAETDALRVAYEEAVRKLDHTLATADSIRNRAGTMMAASAAVAAFLGGIGLKVEGGLKTGELLIAGTALVCFLLCFGLAMAVLLPKEDAWEVGRNTEKLADAILGEDVTRASTKYVYWAIAVDYQRWARANNERNTDLGRHLTVSSGFLVAEVLFLAWLVGATST